MPSTIAPSHSGAATKLTAKKHHSKRARIVRRRGRGSLDSDDEIEREARTDSDTDDDSSVTSVSDSESVSDDDEQHGGIVTPSTQSPPPLDIPGASGSVKPTLVNSTAGPFVRNTDWAQLVADENAHGAGDLPVIDFNDMHTHEIPEPTPPPPRPRGRNVKQNKKAGAASRTTAPSSPGVRIELAPQEAQPEEGDVLPDEPVPPTSRPAHIHEPRKRGQSARQAYQERLQADPAFVPRVGEFWGHDDRLLDKDLRSLSGWWRGRWQGRGRGRGFPMRGRGNRFFPGPPPASSQEGDGEEEQSVEEKQEVPPIEKTWKHDGFEEMKRREDQRREEQRRSQVSRQSINSQRGAATRGRGGFAVRGRGSFSRGNTIPSAGGQPRAGLRTDLSSNAVWYTMKPEKVWTKRADNFLYSESALRSRAAETQSIHIKLPGHEGRQVVRQKKMYNRSPIGGAKPTSCSGSTEDSERQFIVRIPAPVEMKKAASATAEGDTPDIPIEEVFTVRPHAAPEHVPIAAPASPQTSETTLSPLTSAQLHATSTHPMPETQRQLEQLGFGTPASSAHGGPSPEIEETLLRNPPKAEVHAPAPLSASETSRPAPPALPPLQTSFSPVPQPSPSYASPYPYGTLPPGIAMSHQGFPYELATGRPVYLHPTPPPMYAPRPMMQSYMGHPSTSVPFVPGHIHHPSQEFIPHPHTPPVSGFVDPATGVPIFAPARQSSRIEIRSPGDPRDGKTIKHARGPSGLRASTTEGETGFEDMVPRDAIVEAQQQQSQVPSMDPVAVAYPPYQQPYYYPDPNGYPGYMDMSNQHVQYDAYPYEQHAQPIIYY